ncbi:MAG: hypothetical protein ABIT08_04395, partial [Bacteroidia bacterium]
MKKIYTLILIVLISFNLKAQFADNWEKKYQFTPSPGYSNEARKIATDASGNVFVMADITSNIDSTGHPTPNTQYYVRLLKYNSSGSLLASNIVNVNNMTLSGGHDFTGSFAMELDASGNVFVAYTVYNTSTYHVGVTKFSNALVRVFATQ